MTALAQRIKETPMAPYMGLIRSMTREQKQIVMMFINETMGEQKEEIPAAQKTNAEIIREKYKNLKLSPEILSLRGCMKLTEEEMQDERTQYILGR